MASRRRLLELTPDDDPLLPQHVWEYGQCILRRLKALDDGDMLREACTWVRCAAELLPDPHKAKPGLLAVLGQLLTVCVTHHHGDGDDIHEAIDVLVRALELIPYYDAARSSCIDYLASALLSLLHLHDIHESSPLARYSSAVDLLPDDHVDKLTLLMLMVLSCRSRFTRNYRRQHYEQAIIDLDMSTALIRRTLEQTRRNPTSDALVPNIHPRFGPLPPTSEFVTWLSANLNLRLLVPGNIAATDLVGAAVAHALEVDDVASALECFDQGHATAWAQIHGFRTPVDELRKKFPVLAQRFERAAQALDSARLQGASQHRDVLQEYRTLLDEIRALDGFQNFYRLKFRNRLSLAALRGPVACINVHSSRCDALILCGSDIHHVPLPKLAPSEVQKWQRALYKALGLRFARNRESRPVVGSLNDGLLDILRRMWMAVVRPIFAVLGWTAVGSVKDRHITWCTRGSLTFLPLHAAGPYYGSLPNAFDLAISSYTPTLAALLPEPNVPAPQPSILVVAQSGAAGGSPLPETKTECDHIRRYFADTPSKFLVDAEGTADAVQANMAAHPYIHLACHGTPGKAPNPTKTPLNQSETGRLRDYIAKTVEHEPMGSAFLLHKSTLTLEDLMARPSNVGELAYLSACGTSKGHERMPDEAMHLAAGMLAVGYRSVVGTMWSISDREAPSVADEFYRTLLESRAANGRVDAAYALHVATEALRKKVGVRTFATWVPFVHFGL
ncbi:hypothetical protein EXIGLDRAFT_85522 [Exidia glandulosa HHB12029]|uniref:CHAT domain-containing protein n=1 Tax=Exidia glandulosa HHB12029 TaxID=1314781 RepID=A0A165HG47_EXIGL|nr:hypothetical protein EXIGLDRAFT_85522 [Exidia glandulosa HHB12029]